MVKVNSVESVKVVGGGEGVVGHAGLWALGRFSDRVGLTGALSGVFPAGEGRGRPVVHDRGRVLGQVILMLAGGGEACTDIRFLGAQPALFGRVASGSTVYRTLRGIDDETRLRLSEAMAGVRERVWEMKGLVGAPSEVVLDVDASLHEIHSDNKEGASAHYKKGYGFHPLYVFSDVTGECLAHMLRPGRAGANTVSDHLRVIDQAINSVPSHIGEGHRPGDPSGLVKRSVRVRVDSAGGPTLAKALRERNIGFSMACRRSEPIRAGLEEIVSDETRWACQIVCVRGWVHVGLSG